MVSTQTIDDRVRQQAREKLMHQISKQLEPMYNLRHQLTSQDIDVAGIIKSRDPNTYTISTYDMLRVLKDHYTKGLAPHFEERAIVDFMNTVAELKNKMDTFESAFNLTEDN